MCERQSEAGKRRRGHVFNVVASVGFFLRAQSTGPFQSHDLFSMHPVEGADRTVAASYGEHADTNRVAPRALIWSALRLSLS